MAHNGKFVQPTFNYSDCPFNPTKGEVTVESPVAYIAIQQTDMFTGELTMGSAKITVKPCNPLSYCLHNLSVLADDSSLYLYSLDEFKTIPNTDFSNAKFLESKFHVELDIGDDVLTTLTMTDATGSTQNLVTQQKLASKLKVYPTSDRHLKLPSGTKLYRLSGDGTTFKKMQLCEPEYMQVVSIMEFPELKKKLYNKNIDRLEAVLEEKEKLQIELDTKCKTITQLQTELAFLAKQIQNLNNSHEKFSEECYISGFKSGIKYTLQKLDKIDNICDYIDIDYYAPYRIDMMKRY